MKKWMTFAALAWAVTACTEEQGLSPATAPSPSVASSSDDALKKAFGTALASALQDSKALRSLIRSKALEMFDRDYDVLYAMIKDEQLDNGQTVRDLLLVYLKDEEKLRAIEAALPTLTIFVPTLPEESFSAKRWNVDQDVPKVGVALDYTNDVSIVDATGKESILEAKYIPAYPVVVVKENERVVHNPDVSTKGRSLRIGGQQFAFLSENFDGRTLTQEEARSTMTMDQTIKDAYTIYSNADGWHRDYIYYGISPTQTSGQFSYDFQETIRSFTLAGDPMSAYNKIADQSEDPKMKLQTTNTNSGWTGGFYEFKVRVLLNAKNGIGEELITYFSAKPTDLFNVTYRKVIFSIYVIESVGFNKMSVNLPLFSWDLNDYASTIKIQIEEVDVTETIKTSETRTVKFASNFSIEGQLLKKIGLKFGASLENTQSQTTERTVTLANDDLGSVIVNFADNVIVSTKEVPIINTTYYNTREYATGWYSISVEPKRVQ